MAASAQSSSQTCFVSACKGKCLSDRNIPRLMQFSAEKQGKAPALALRSMARMADSHCDEIYFMSREVVL